MQEKSSAQKAFTSEWRKWNINKLFTNHSLTAVKTQNMYTEP